MTKPPRSRTREHEGSHEEHPRLGQTVSTHYGIRKNILGRDAAAPFT
ncbi:MAG: hypothetical protein HKL85_02735 [Acidimicrobiaceae bacterium]|nr:hypothetical protein [Acidimicrobiaceae bacterium]